MPSIINSHEENVQYLYLVLTHGGNPTVDWDPICATLDLQKGAVTKRWSRLKKSIEAGEKATSANHEFLWLMVKHSTRKKAMDWEAIAKLCNSTKGACSKRYSRLKTAFENGDAAPKMPTKGSNSAPTTPSKITQKSTATAESDDDDTGIPTPTPKRKRALAQENPECEVKATSETDEEEAFIKPKRVKSTPRSKAKPKNGFRASDQNVEAEEAKVVIKGEPVDEDSDVFFDAPQQAYTYGTSATDEDEILSASISVEALTHARDVANLLLNRKSDLTRAYREELESMMDVFGEAI